MQALSRLLRSALYIVHTFMIFAGCSSADQSLRPALHIVEIREMKFQPSQLTISKGDTVLWINHDIVEHNITEETSKIWGSPVIRSGESWSLVVEKSSDYFCSIHVVMKGKVLVK